MKAKTPIPAELTPPGLRKAAKTIATLLSVNYTFEAYSKFLWEKKDYCPVDQGPGFQQQNLYGDTHTCP